MIDLFKELGYKTGFYIGNISNDFYSKLKENFSLKSGDVNDNSLDFVYIDGIDKSYNNVINSLNIWSKKVRKGGIISGYDYKVYFKPNPESQVYEGVNQFTKDNNIQKWFVFGTRIVDASIMHRKYNPSGTFMMEKI